MCFMKKRKIYFSSIFDQFSLNTVGSERYGTGRSGRFLFYVWIVNPQIEKMKKMRTEICYTEQCLTFLYDLI